MIELTIHELHFLMRQIEARIEWIADNPHDESIEENEQSCVESLLGKLLKLKIKMEFESSDNRNTKSGDNKSGM